MNNKEKKSKFVDGRTVGEVEKCLHEQADFENKPPREPYFVKTDQPLVGKIEPISEDLLDEYGREKAPYVLDMDAHVETAAEMTCQQLSRLMQVEANRSPEGDNKQLKFLNLDLETKEWEVILQYPLKGSYLYNIELPTRRADLIPVGGLIWAVAQGYRNVYADPERFGIWGHAMVDLFIERMFVYPEKTLIRCSIGS